MASTIVAMTLINSNTLNTTNSPKFPNPTKLITKATSLKNITTTLNTTKLTTSITGTALAGAVFSTLGTCDPAFAAQQIAEIAEGGDNRGLALLLPIIPAIGWVLFNILQPTLNQINKMRNSKGVIIGLGLGGLASSSFISTKDAMANDIVSIAEASGSDNRGQLLLFVIAPAILWVLYNILQPALNQINKMRSK
ncbi:photosystem II reaction center proteins PsbY, chloroplastic-like [Cicer arietinum]|uniref:Photosystem II core complex proteins psbY, chloroplastic-like n=1 Tax=Cicer arietinum TaxID=3827 RepID=A0A1S2YFR2_CICAR|nr:photosystem II core complex proteins psbY, chloroplastic-like [Cicer arietinum]